MYRASHPSRSHTQYDDYAVPEPPIHPQDKQSRDFSYSKLDNRRKQTLLNLLSALSELSQAESYGQDLNLGPNQEDDRDVPTVDDQLQVAGAEIFNRFYRRVNNLDKELRNFANAARQLGSSVGILSTAFRLRERLARVLFLFRENAADLFPRKVSRQARETLVNPNVMEKRRRKNRSRTSMWGEFEENINSHLSIGTSSPPLHSTQTNSNMSRPFSGFTLDAEFFPEHFEAFATDVVAFLNCLNEFPEFTDEAVNTSIRAFEGDLKYWACCLRTYRGQFKYPAVQRYIHDLTSEMGDHIDSITSTLSMFIEVGVPTIRFAQKHGASNLLNLSTVATFFSAVTATTLQFSYSSTSTVLAKSVNAFWFSSLVFSIAAAVNSLLGLSWKMAMYRSPGHRVPWWVLIWIKRSPLVFLVMSVACFSAGLVLFTYATGQGKVTSTITTVFTAFTSFGLAAVSAWFASEKWTFVRYRGQKWLEDVLGEAWTKVAGLLEAMMTPFVWVAWPLSLIWRGLEKVGCRVWEGIEHSLAGLVKAGAKARRGLIWVGVRLGVRSEVEVEESKGSRRVPSISTSFRTAVTGMERDDLTVLPLSNSSQLSQGRFDAQRFGRPHSSRLGRPDLRLSMEFHETSSPTTSSHGHPTSGIATIETASEVDIGDRHSTTHISPRDRFRHAIQSVMMLQSASASAGAVPSLPTRKRTTSSALTNFSVHTGSSITNIRSSSILCENLYPRIHGTTADRLSGLRGSRLPSLIPKLDTLVTTQDILAHSALVRHLQFSPNGKFLATSSWDRTSIIFKVGEPLVPHRVLAHASGFVGQVAWAPHGSLLLTKLARVIKVWTEDGVCRKTIDRQCAIQAVSWLPGGEAFMSVEGSEVVKLDLNGKVLDTYDFGRVLIHDVAITPDSVRLLCVGPILSSPTGLQPSKSRVEKQLLVYNVETKQIENQTPVLNDVRDITLTRIGQAALISYENKAPPQLWKLEMLKDRMDSTTMVGRLTLRHTYTPKMPVDFAGRSYFGGKDDQLVLCAGKAGDIHIWDRESAVLLHHIRAQDLGGDLTCIAWNHSAEDPFMFATGSHNGAVRIWTTPSDHNILNHSAQSTPHSVTPRPRSLLNLGANMSAAELQREALDNVAIGSITAKPLTLSPEEEMDQPNGRCEGFARLPS